MSNADDEKAAAEAEKLRAEAAKTAAEAEKLLAEAARTHQEADRARVAAAPRFSEVKTTVAFATDQVFRQHEVRWEALQAASESLADGVGAIPAGSRVLLTADESLLRSLVVHRRLDWAVDMLISACAVALDEPNLPPDLGLMPEALTLLGARSPEPGPADARPHGAVAVGQGEAETPTEGASSTPLGAADIAVAAAAAGAGALREITGLFSAGFAVPTTAGRTAALDAQISLLATLTAAQPDVRFVHDSFRSLSIRSPLVRKVSILTARLARLGTRASELQAAIGALPARSTEEKGVHEGELAAVTTLIQAVTEFMGELGAPVAEGAATPLLVALSGEQLASGAPFTHAMLVPEPSVAVDQVVVKRVFFRARITVSGSAQMKFLLIALPDGEVVQAGTALGVSGYTVKFGRRLWTEWRREPTLAEATAP